MKKITDEQNALLSVLKCERLSSCEENLRLVSSFGNNISEPLTDQLQGDAFTEDEDGVVAYYLIKDEDGNILFYFSLKCGQMFDRIKLFEQDYYTRFLLIILNEILSDKNLSERQKQLISERRDSIIKRKGITKSELQNILNNKHILESKPDKTQAVNVKKVDNTFPCIEIVHFCKNENCKTKWTKEQIPHRLGTIVFWQFIVPIVLQVRELVGCQYLYLFAADLDPEETLVKYYMHSMDFEISEDCKTAIPAYDVGCKLMWQDIQNLKERMDYFFDNFNAEYTPPQ